MSSIPASFTRTPTLLISQLNTQRLTDTNLEALRLQSQMSTGLRVARPSDDPIAAAGITVMERIISRDGQQDTNLAQAVGVMNTIDSSLGELADIASEAAAIASEQVGITSDSVTRTQQADVIQSYIDQLYDTMNREYAGMSLFAGSATTIQAIEDFEGGFRYQGDLGGLRVDSGDEIDFPITLSADRAVGAVSARQQGANDLNPQLTDNTRLRDLRGSSLGRDIGTLNITLTAPGPAVTNIEVDLSDAETIGDVRVRIDEAIRAADPAALDMAHPNGVRVDAATFDRLEIDVAAGYQIDFTDGPVGQTATALGLSSISYQDGGPGLQVSLGANDSLDPLVTNRTVLADLQAVPALVAGHQIRIDNGPKSGTLTIDPTWSVDRLKEEVDQLGVGVRVEIDPDGNRINFVNEVSGFDMRIAEVGTGTAATTLGVRTLQASTLISQFNDGRGVEIADGDSDPTRNIDFRITLTDPAQSFDVDLTPADMVDASTVVAAINAAAAAGGFGATFTASLDANTNGIRFDDTLAGGSAIQVTQLNGFAAEDLGLLTPQAQVVDGEYIASDQTGVRVDSLFTTLIDLRDALLTDDQRAITDAGERLTQESDRLISARAVQGGRTARVEDARNRIADRMLLNETIKSDLQELDFFEATTRFTALETQLQASLSVTARLSQLTLINFI
ncbi:MAG: flagellin [Planctomycetota bacterium]